MNDPSASLVTVSHPHTVTQSTTSHIDKGLLTKSHAVETNGVKYLAYCFARARNEGSYSCHANYGLPEDVQTVRSKVIDECLGKITKMTG